MPSRELARLCDDTMGTDGELAQLLTTAGPVEALGSPAGVEGAEGAGAPAVPARPVPAQLPAVGRVWGRHGELARVEVVPAGARAGLCEHQDADVHYRRALELFTATGSTWGAACALAGIGEAHLVRGNPDAAPAPLSLALEPHRGGSAAEGRGSYWTCLRGPTTRRGAVPGTVTRWTSPARRGRG